MVVIDNFHSGESDWIQSTYPSHGDAAFGCGSDVVITFAKTVSSSALTRDHFRILDNNGTEIQDVFLEIVPSHDYNEISRTLSLRLTTSLDASSEYTLVIDGLYGPTGETQDQAHSVTFSTDDFSVDIPEAQDVEDAIEVEDRSLLDHLLVLSSGAQARLITTLPTRGAYNLSEGYNNGLVTVRLSETVVSASVLIERRVISVVDGSWDIVSPESVEIDQQDDRVIRVQLPEVSSGVYLEAGYEYKVVISGATELATGPLGTDLEASLFTGPLRKMYTTVASVLMQYPSASSYDVAKIIYIASSYAYSIDDEIIDSTPTKAATDYALYSTLWKLSTRGGDQKMIQLGDLIVEKGEQMNLQEQWRRLSEDALARLGNVGPEVTIKGGSTASPFTTRNW